MATIILNTEASVFDHSVRMKFGDVYVLPTTLLNGENLFRLMNFFLQTSGRGVCEPSEFNFLN